MKLGKSLNIADLIRKPRQQLNLSQEKLRASLGVSQRTVNCWVNTSVVPSEMALKLIEEMLENMGEPRNKLLTEYLSKARQREDS
ncbi:MAG: helix-turn-helix domain-containing protein [Nostoc sp. CreGUA01]|nr:helix-turn-helix domain-containing protein [Nostoc sp. CreGUA01]